MEKYTINQRHIMEAVIVNLSILRHQQNTEAEKMEIRKNMEDLISSMDKNKIPWKLQNSLFYIGETYDVRKCYVDDLCNMAYNRVYA